ncbi:anti-sigma factor domain-containing protein [Demequina sp. NBRC 110057]|uniref:anti-sigma factor domain-containing protein n=1 Tax=Demequina sp. NBRC 110057 TaxID=1570346 RepID=UPI0013565EAD|nr:anti-sigma factor [Demequina sp. NBRC 110057]
MSEELHTLAAPYVVDALEPAERDAFEAHLATCADCREEVASLALATEELAASHAVTPPPSLRAAVMAEVSRTPQLPPVVEPVAEPAAEPAADAGATADAVAGRTAGASVSSAAPAASVDVVDGDAASVTPLARRRAGRSRRWWIAAPVAAVSLAVLVVGGVMIADARSDRAAQQALEADALEVAGASDMEAMAMDLGTGRLMVSAETGSVALLGSSAPVPDEGREYQVWLVMRDGTVVAGPTFTPGADGDYLAVSDADVAQVAAVALTEEPEGGSEAPTMEPFAVTEMPAEA